MTPRPSSCTPGRVLAVALLALAPAPAGAQDASPPPGPAPAPEDCAPKAAMYAAATPAAPRVWVLRRGVMALPENPLRPLSRDEAVVLEVVVNGRRATAWGPDTDHLRQGGAPPSVEREGAGPIRWAAKAQPAPALRVVADDGRVLLGPMLFGGCEDAPAARPVASTPGKATSSGEAAKRGRATPGPAGASPGPARSDAHLPQGALDGPGLAKGAPPR